MYSSSAEPIARHPGRDAFSEQDDETEVATRVHAFEHAASQLLVVGCEAARRARRHVGRDQGRFLFSRARARSTLRGCTVRPKRLRTRSANSAGRRDGSPEPSRSRSPEPPCSTCGSGAGPASSAADRRVRRARRQTVCDLGSVTGFACFQPSDECIEDADCEEKGAHCVLGHDAIRTCQPSDACVIP